MAGGTKNFVTKIEPGQSAKLRDVLDERCWELDQLAYAHFRARRDKTTVVSYESGKLVVQGKGTADFVQFILEPEILGEVRMGYEAERAQAERPDMFLPHAGIDESGKGDYFGPLVVATVYVDADSSRKLLSLGVTDSKKIGSDRKIASLAEKVRQTVYGRWSVVPIGPQAYNRLYDKIGNVNKLLAWGHARALENLLEKVPDCPRAVSDQFGRKETVQQALMVAGRKIELEQYPKAEADIAVAAASILARDEFVQRLERLGQEVGLTLPKGAGQNVLTAARRLVESRGKTVLADLAKTHFKTTEKVLYGSD